MNTNFLKVGDKVGMMATHKFGLPARPARGEILSFTTRTSQCGSSVWAYVKWTRLSDNFIWEDWRCVTDLK